MAFQKSIIIFFALAFAATAQAIGLIGGATGVSSVQRTNQHVPGLPVIGYGLGGYGLGLRGGYGLGGYGLGGYGLGLRGGYGLGSYGLGGYGLGLRGGYGLGGYGLGIWG